MALVHSIMRQTHPMNINWAELNMDATPFVVWLLLFVSRLRFKSVLGNLGPMSLQSQSQDMPSHITH